ncbi:hypothetical protein AC578_3823 [Pseudocercospora eumusae]|uniref:Uncharacterized protein n=1 Tax=Pseudocercospora eumusae TaxID=321146 RepID=A0A139HFL9_9PEZI|nr:hypothetical protein AC578_3823 [Pseudocercospora eumusae]
MPAYLQAATRASRQHMEAHHDWSDGADHGGLKISIDRPSTQPSTNIQFKKRNVSALILWKQNTIQHMWPPKSFRYINKSGERLGIDHDETSPEFQADNDSAKQLMEAVAK